MSDRGAEFITSAFDVILTENEHLTAKLAVATEALEWIDSDKGDEAWKKYVAHNALAKIREDV